MVLIIIFIWYKVLLPKINRQCITMNVKNTPIINPKKIPYYLFLLLLTLGASLILGFLSFGGMFALIPILPLAFAAFGLSVAYEGEIYLQNIKGALNKLFKNNFLKNHLAKEFLLNNFPENTKEDECPQFFRDYRKQLKLLSTFGHQHLNKESKNRKKRVEKTLKDMEKWFALQLFQTENTSIEESSIYAKELQIWLKKNKKDEWQSLHDKRRLSFHGVKAFSLLAGAFMGLGTTYLIVEAFTVIPFFAAIPFVFWPILILPMAIIAGTAYGLLTYNAITDLINNDTLNKWYIKLRDSLRNGVTLTNIFMTTTAVLLVALAIALTVCTAGTWWTVATTARPLFEWMTKMPSFVMGVINPIITGLSAIFFNVQNTAESLEMVDQATRIEENIFTTLYKYIREGCTNLPKMEHWLQIINPFRILLKLTVTPLRIILFLGHLVSIGVTSDRMPGVPQILAALIAIISEGFEDAHYFIGSHHDDHHHDHEAHKDHHHDTKSLLKERLDPSHGHSHDMDIPTLLLQAVASPLYLLAATWDFLTSKRNRPTSSTETASKQTRQPEVLSFSKAWNKQRGLHEEKEVTLKNTKSKHLPSEAWKVEQVVSLIEKHKTKHLKSTLFGKALAEAKIIELNQLQNKIRASGKDNPLSETIEQAKTNNVLNQHRLFTVMDKETQSQHFIDKLSCVASQYAYKTSSRTQ